MTHYQLVLAFLMTIENLKDLHAKIAHDLQCNPVKVCNSNGSPIAPECRIMSGALGVHTFFSASVNHPFYESLWTVFPIVFDMGS
jgi:hypothetical protein